MSNDEKRERPVSGRELRMLEQIGQRDAARQLYRDRQSARRANTSKWGYALLDSRVHGKRK